MPSSYFPNPHLLNAPSMNSIIGGARSPSHSQNYRQQSLKKSATLNTTFSFSANSALKINTLKSPKKPPLKNKSWWHRRPIFLDRKDGGRVNIQKISRLAPVYSVILALLQISQSFFNFFCLLMAFPGAHYHFASPVSLLFVYSGNQIVRFSLMATSAVLLFAAIYVFFASIVLALALQKEHELLIKPWLQAMVIFSVFRLLALIFQSTVNDLIFRYHQLNLAFWTLVILSNTFFWLVVLSNYQELCDMTRLEDTVSRSGRIRLGSASSLRSFTNGHQLSEAIFPMSSLSASYASIYQQDSGFGRGGVFGVSPVNLLSRPPPFELTTTIRTKSFGTASSSPVLNQSLLELWCERNATPRRDTSAGSRYNLQQQTVSRASSSIFDCSLSRVLSSGSSNISTVDYGTTGNATNATATATATASADDSGSVQYSIVSSKVSHV